MPTTLLIHTLGYALSIFYGFAAIYLVFETRNQCPFRWPLLFGLIGCLNHLAIHDVPVWWPPSITRDMIVALFLLAVLALGIALFQRLIDEYDLRPPWSIVTEWRAGETTDWADYEYPYDAYRDQEQKRDD